MTPTVPPVLLVCEHKPVSPIRPAANRLNNIRAVAVAVFPFSS